MIKTKMSEELRKAIEESEREYNNSIYGETLEEKPEYVPSGLIPSSRHMLHDPTFGDFNPFNKRPKRRKTILDKVFGKDEKRSLSSSLH